MSSSPAHVVAVSCDLGFGWWRVRLRPAGPAALLEAKLGDGVLARFDSAQPDVVLDLEVIPPDGRLGGAAVELAAQLFGRPAADAMRRGTDAEVVAFQPDIGSTAVRLRRLLALAAHERELPAAAVVDLAREVDAVSRLVAAADLAAFLNRYAITCAARAAYHLRQLADRDALALPPGVGDSLDEAVATVSALLGSDVDLGWTSGATAAAASPGAHQSELLFAELDEFDTTPVHRSGARRQRGDPAEVEVVACDLAFGLVEMQIAGTSIGAHRITGRVVHPADLHAPANGSPRVWVRAIAADSGALLYEAQCQVSDALLTADLYAPGNYPDDFWLDFTHDLTVPPKGATAVRADRARRVGARAAALQESAHNELEWVEIARMWEQSAHLWRLAGDPARRALSAVHAIRAYRAAGPTHELERSTVEVEARAVMARLDAGWLAPDPQEPAVGDPLLLKGLLRSAALTPYLNAWVVRSLDALANDARCSRAERDEPGGSPGPNAAIARRVEELAQLAGQKDRAVRTARARARVALAVWAARTGRRRLAHSILVPIAIDFALLDQRGRAELAEANRVLADAPMSPDPDAIEVQSGPGADA